MRNQLVILISLLLLTANVVPCSAEPVVSELKTTSDTTSLNPINTTPIVSGEGGGSAESLSVIERRLDSKDSNTNLHPIKVLHVVRDEGWKSSDRFEISNTEGLQGIYDAEEQIVFHVEGKSEKLFVEEANGFGVAATIFDRSIKVGHRAIIVTNHAEVEYDPVKRDWQVKLTAPKIINDKYAVVVHLYCAKKDSPCAETFGLGTQINKIVPLQVRLTHR